MNRTKHQPKDAKKLKDWFDRTLVDELAGRFQQHLDGFERERFLAFAGDGLEKLEMMDRVRQIARAMNAGFSGSTAHIVRGLIEVMGPPLAQEEGGDGPIGSGYLLWPLGEYIGRYGLDDWASSWQAMEELTQRLTSEFAVRPYLAADLEESLKRLRALVDHPSHHVRRWASEGTRTRLPWAKAVPALQDALPQRLEILENLKDDPSKYVRRSVANHLQDILKDDLKTGLEVLERWSAAGSPHGQWVVKHAARGLLKAGHPRVLALFGWDRPVEVAAFSVSPSLLIRDQQALLSAKLRNLADQPARVRIDYLWDGPTPTGRRFSKTFRWTDLVLEAKATADLSKAHPFVERSTRRLPQGDYSFTLLVNGNAFGPNTVRLEA